MITMDDDIPNTRCCRVRGDCIQCPFHNWRFSGETGRCVEAAYSSARLPDQARLGVRTSLERNGLVLVWHHAGDAVQCYSVPRVVTSYLRRQRAAQLVAAGAGGGGVRGVGVPGQERVHGQLPHPGDCPRCPR